MLFKTIILVTGCSLAVVAKPANPSMNNTIPTASPELLGKVAKVLQDLSLKKTEAENLFEKVRANNADARAKFGETMKQFKSSLDTAQSNLNKLLTKDLSVTDTLYMQNFVVGVASVNREREWMEAEVRKHDKDGFPPQSFDTKALYDQLGKIKNKYDSPTVGSTAMSLWYAIKTQGDKARTDEAVKELRQADETLKACGKELEAAFTSALQQADEQKQNFPLNTYSEVRSQTDGVYFLASVLDQVLGNGALTGSLSVGLLIFAAFLASFVL